MPTIVRPQGHAIAYVKTAATDAGAHLPTVMFLGGYRSDMEGTKALYLEAQCAARGQGFVRFDYSGHGQSGGAFADGTIGSWRDDAQHVMDTLTDGPVILAGSSMGGWISLLLGRDRPDRVAGIVGIAAAPDFTREIRARLSEDHKAQLAARGYFEEPNDYSDEPYMFTARLLEDGEERCLLDGPIAITAPVRLVQGMKDTDVPWQKAHRIKNAITGGNVEVFLVEEGDHRLSRPEDLALIGQQVELLSALAVQ